MNDSVFQAMCVKHLGGTPEHIRYKILDLEDRIKSVEEYIDKNFPIIATGILKTESIASILIEKDVISSSEIDKYINDYSLNLDKKLK